MLYDKPTLINIHHMFIFIFLVGKRKYC